MAAEKWRPGQTTAKGKDDLPKRQTDLNHTTIEQWIDEYGTEKDKAWFVQAAEEYQKEVVFYKWDEPGNPLFPCWSAWAAACPVLWRAVPSKMNATVG